MDVSEKRRMRDGMDPQAKEVEDAKDTMFSLRCDIGIMDTRCWLPRFYRGDPCGDMLLSKDAIKQVSMSPFHPCPSQQSLACV